MLALGFGASLSGAQAAHCTRLTKVFDDLKKIDAQIDEADSREDMDAACRLQTQSVALIRKTLKNTRAECFHGGKQAFEFTLDAALALEELYCSWDDGFFDEEDYFDDEDF